MDTLISTVVIVSCAFASGVPSAEVRVRLLEEVDAVIDGHTHATLALHTFADYGPVEERHESIIPRHPRRTGFAISSLAQTPSAEAELLWVRPHVMIHIPARADWEPIKHDIGTLWWDERTDTLWLAFAVTTSHQSMIHVDRLIMRPDSNTDDVRPAEFVQVTHQINHVRGNLERIEALKIRSAADDGVVLEVIHREGPHTTISVEKAERAMPADEARRRQYVGTEVDLLEEAVQQQIRKDRQHD